MANPQELLEEARRYHQASDFKKGLKTAEKARKTALKDGDGSTAIEALRVMGDCALNARDMKSAQMLYSDLLTEAGPSGNRFYQAAASWGLGQLAMHKMSYFEAITIFSQGLGFAESISDGWYTAWNAFGLGTAHRGVGNLEKASFYYQKATSSFDGMNQTAFSKWVKRALQELKVDSSAEVQADMKMWLCPLCGSKFKTKDAELLRSGKIVACEYCGTSVG